MSDVLFQTSILLACTRSFHSTKSLTVQVGLGTPSLHLRVDHIRKHFS